MEGWARGGARGKREGEVLEESCRKGENKSKTCRCMVCGVRPPVFCVKVWCGVW